MAAKPIVRVAILQQSVPIVDGQGRPTPAFVRLTNDNNGNVVATLTAIAQIPEIQAALVGLDQATQDAMDAAAAAIAATAATKREAALQGSYIEPDTVLSATPTTITVGAHVRRYADGTSANVSGGTVAVTAAGDTDYVSYSDPTRTGGTVTYVASTTTPTQTGSVHVVGAVATPATGTATGGEGPRRPGFVQAKFNAGNQTDI